MRSTGVLAVCATLLAALGAYYRFHDLVHQCLGGDELHALRVARTRSFWDILAFYSKADNSIPLTLYAHLLDKTVGLSELRFRAPVALCGFLLMLTPLLFAKQVRATAAVFGVALMAASPPLIYFSIVARPYAPAALNLVLSLFLWNRWVSGGSRRAGVGFGATAAIACWFHLYCVFPVLLLFLISLGLALRRRLAYRSLVSAATVGFLLGLALLGPGLGGMLQYRATKIGGNAFEIEYLVQATQRLSAFDGGGTIVLFLAGGVGAARLVARARLFGATVISLVLLQCVSVLATGPLGDAVAWSRYLMLVWPLLLLLVGAGLEALVATLQNLAPVRGRVGTHTEYATTLASMCSILLAACLFAYTPSDVLDLRRNSFRSSRNSLGARMPARTAAPVYVHIAADPGAGDTLLECATENFWRDWDRQREAQRAHGKWVRMVSIRRAGNETPDTRFRNLMALEDESALRESGARYLVLHLKPSRLASAEGDRRRRAVQAIARVMETLRARYGEPVWQDEVSVAFTVR